MLMLLDRDGVLNHDREDFVKSPDELVMIDGAAEAVARLTAAGHRVVVVTNQSALGRGLIDETTLARIHEKLHEAIRRAGGHLDDILYCPDPPWAAGPRRKPAPGMLREALSRYRVAPEAAPMIGDRLRDLEAATAAGCPRLLVRTGVGAETQAEGIPSHVLPVAVYDDLAAAVDALLERAI
jgi:D-glycero-D-manno-heptose 1,7-bisphosphate phosphatase